VGVLTDSVGSDSHGGTSATGSDCRATTTAARVDEELDASSDGTASGTATMGSGCRAVSTDAMVSTGCLRLADAVMDEHDTRNGDSGGTDATGSGGRLPTRACTPGSD